VTIYERVYNAIIEIRRSIGAVFSVAGKIGDVTLDADDIEWSSTNDNATPGSIGEYVDAEVESGSAVSLSAAGSGESIVSISLAAGDWYVYGLVNFTLTNATVISAASQITSNGPGAISFTPDTVRHDLNTDGATGYRAHAIPGKRISLDSTTTIRILSALDVETGSAAAYGFIAAHRIR
jgi:hypothetical protein